MFTKVRHERLLTAEIFCLFRRSGAFRPHLGRADLGSLSARTRSTCAWHQDDLLRPQEGSGDRRVIAYLKQFHADGKQSIRRDARAGL
jgi:hypothetical protein